MLFVDGKFVDVPLPSPKVHTPLWAEIEVLASKLTKTGEQLLSGENVKSATMLGKIVMFSVEMLTQPLGFQTVRLIVYICVLPTEA